MWPGYFGKWLQLYEEDARIIIRGRLVQCRAFRDGALRSFMRRLEENAVARAGQVARYLRQYRDYFKDAIGFQRWLKTISYKEALRLVLNPEPCEVVLGSMAPEDRRLLWWRYVDQVSDDECARLLDLRMTGRPLFDAEAARDRSIQAYLEFCRRLQKRFPSPGEPQGSLGPTFELMFPLFPGTRLGG